MAKISLDSSDVVERLNKITESLDSLNKMADKISKKDIQLKLDTKNLDKAAKQLDPLFAERVIKFKIDNTSLNTLKKQLESSFSDIKIGTTSTTSKPARQKKQVNTTYESTKVADMGAETLIKDAAQLNKQTQAELRNATKIMNNMLAKQYGYNLDVPHGLLGRAKLWQEKNLVDERTRKFNAIKPSEEFSNQEAIRLGEKTQEAIEQGKKNVKNQQKNKNKQQEIKEASQAGKEIGKAEGQAEADARTKELENKRKQLLNKAKKTGITNSLLLEATEIDPSLAKELRLQRNADINSLGKESYDRMSLSAMFNSLNGGGKLNSINSLGDMISAQAAFGMSAKLSSLVGGGLGGGLLSSVLGTGLSSGLSGLRMQKQKDMLEKYMLNTDEYKNYAASAGKNANMQDFRTSMGIDPKTKRSYSRYAKSQSQVMEQMIGDKSGKMMGNFAKAGIAATGWIGLAVVAIAKLTEGVIKFTKESLASYEQIQSYKTRLGVIYGTQTEADASFNKIEAYAKKSPFGVETMTQQAILLKQSGVNGSELMDTMSRLGDIASGNAEKMKSVSEVYARIQSSMTVTARDMRQLANAGVPAYKALVESMKQNGAAMYGFDKERSQSITTQNMRSYLQSGKIKAEDFENMLKYLTNKGGQFYNATEIGAKTLLARKQNLEDARQMAKAAVGEQFANWGARGTNDSIYQNLISIKEGVWQTVENTSKAEINKNTKDRLRFTKSDVNYIDDVIESLGNPKNLTGSNKKYYNDLVKLREEKANSLEELYNKNLSAIADEFAQMEIDRKLSSVSNWESRLKLADAGLSKVGTISKPIYDLVDTIALGNKHTQLSSGDASVQTTLLRIFNPLSMVTGKISQNDMDAVNPNGVEGEVLEKRNSATISKGREKFINENFESVKLAHNMRRFTDNVSKGAEALNKLATASDSALTKMAAAKQANEGTTYGKRLQTISDYEDNQKIKNKIYRIDAKYKTESGAYNFSKGKVSDKLGAIDLIGEAEQLKLGYTDLFDVATGKRKLGTGRDWNTYKDNINEFTKVMQNSFGKDSDFDTIINSTLTLNRQLQQGVLNTDSYKNVVTMQGNLTDSITARINNYKRNIEGTVYNKEDKARFSKYIDELENALKLLELSGSRVSLDSSNVGELNKRMNPMLWQNVAANSLGLNSTILQQLSNGEKLGSIGRGTGKGGTWTGSDIFNNLYKDNMAQRKTYAGLMSTMLSSGRSLREIASTLTSDKTRARDEKNQLDYFDWTKSTEALEQIAANGSISEQQGLISQYNERLNEITSLLTSSITSQEELNEMIDPASSLGVSINMMVDRIDGAGLTFHDKVVQAADDMRTELIGKLTKADINLINNTRLEQAANKDLRQKNLNKLLSYGTGYLNLSNENIFTYSDELQSLMNEQIDKLASTKFKGASSNPSISTSKLLLELAQATGRKDWSEAEGKGNEVIDNEINNLYEKYKANSLTPKEESLWTRLIISLTDNSETSKNLISSLESLKDETERTNKLIKTNDAWNKLYDYGAEAGLGGERVDEIRKNRSLFNTNVEKNLLGLFGFEEDTRLNKAYSTISERFNNFMSGEYMQGVKTSSDIYANPAIYSYEKTLDLSKAYDEYYKEVQKDIKSAKTKLTTEHLYNVLNPMLNKDVVEQSEKNIDSARKGLEEQERVQKELYDEQNKKLQSAERNTIDFLKWKNVDTSSPEFNSYLTNNEKSLNLVGNYLSTKEGQNKLLGLVKKNGYDENNIQYKALKEKIGDITEVDEEGNFVGFKGDLEDVANILYQIGKMNGFDQLSESIMKGIGATELLKKSIEELASGMVNAFKDSALNAYLSSTKMLGQELYKVNEGSRTMSESWEALGKNLGQITSGLLEQTGTLLTNAGLAIVQAGAMKGDWGAVAGGLLMAAAGGVANISAGWLDQASQDDSNDNDKLSRIEALKDNLAELIEQARNDAKYYESTLRSKQAIAFNDSVSTTKVNDMILTPQGNFSTSPQDYLIATKNPASLASPGAVSFNIINNGEPVTIESSRENRNSNGGMDIEVVINSVVQKGMMNGDYDSTFTAMQAKQQGNVVSA